jgi:putative transposase
VLLTFYDFPAENWCHIRTTNPIESTFATIRLRHRRTKNNGSAKASLVMIFKLAQSAAKGWRKLRGHQHIPELMRGIRFIDGINEHSVNEQKNSNNKTPATHTEIVA